MKRFIKALILSLFIIQTVPNGVVKAEFSKQTKINPTMTFSKTNKTVQIPQEIRDAWTRILAAHPDIASLTLVESDFFEGDDYDGPARWIFFLEESTDKETPNSMAIVELEAKSGRLYSLFFIPAGAKPKNPPSRSTAKRAANEFLTKVWGEYAKHYRLTTIENVTNEIGGRVQKPALSEVSYDLTMHGIPVEGFGIEVIVDGKGRVLFLVNHAIRSAEPADFPDPNQAISAKSANEIYHELLGVSLSYVQLTDEEKRKGLPPLIYSPSFREGAIDAITGELSNEIDFIIYQQPERVSIKPQGNKLVAKSRKQAENLIQNEFEVSLKDLRYDRTTYPDKKTVKYAWKSAPKTKKEDYVELLVERKSGRVLEYTYFDEDYDRPEQKVSFEKAQKMALKTLARYADADKGEDFFAYGASPFIEEEYPDWIEPEEDDYWPFNQNYVFWFHESYEGIKVGYSRYDLEINPETGKIMALSFHNEPLKDLPKPDGIISVEEATKILADAQPLELRYVWPTYEDQVRPSPILVYVPKNKDIIFWVDAFTGKLHSYNMKSQAESGETP